ncbi:hypothetical protein PRZ48_014255 [Zasmidium cellare]|uniref:Heterokaryon incompatibility domain-containing protein n=1 Tax=Zasmidium cellare TaxID=395010 RepID=A0ABR0E0G2_ZASCE|nr:hypothetical protein PRZ48_014255 [Zasmidium cellare]
MSRSAEHFEELVATFDHKAEGANDLYQMYEVYNMYALVDLVDEVRTLVHDISLNLNADESHDDEAAYYAKKLRDLEPEAMFEAWIQMFRASYPPLTPDMRAAEQLFGLAEADYEAVSYCWGDSRRTASMSLNGQSFEAPASAVEALQRFRHSKNSRVVWIDAICIDQADLKEKQFQIEMMVDVYRTASRTLAWLGNVTEEYIDLAPMICEDIGTYLTTDEVSRVCIVGSQTGLCDWFRERDIEPRCELSLAVYHPLAPEQCVAASTICLQVVAEKLQILSSDTQSPYHNNAERCAAREVTRENVARELASRTTHSSADTLSEPFQPSPNRQAFQAIIDWMGQGVTAAVLVGLKALLNKPWFTRLWVFQEMVNSPKLLCHLGHKVIDWQHFTITMDMFLRADPAYIRSYFMLEEGDISMKFWSLRLRLAIASTPDASLLDLACDSHTLDVRVPQDRIFALLSMTQWARNGAPLPQELRPNYSLSVRDCMCLATKAMIQETRTLEVFYKLGVPIGIDRQASREEPSTKDAATHRDDVDEEWPSWCPKWHEPVSAKDHDLVPGPQVCANQGAQMYNTLCEGRKAVISSVNDLSSPAVLFLEGTVVDTIEATCSGDLLLQTRQHIDDVGDAMQRTIERVDGGLVEQFAALMQYSFTDPGLLLTLLETIRKPLQGSTSLSTAQLLEALLPPHTNYDAVRLVEQLNTPESHDDNLRALVIKAYEHLVRVCMRAMVFRSKAGRIGVGPPTTKPGDSVVILWGGLRPFILRPVAEHHAFLGVAHVQSIMHGEAVREWEEAGRAVTTFELR